MSGTSKSVKDGPEDGGESRNSKCGHYDWQREGVG